MLVRHKKLVIGAVLLCLLAGGVYVMQYMKKNYRDELLSNVVVQRMIPTYRSIRKLPDLVFMPWSAFAKSDLETYELIISPQDIERMNSSLPESPFYTNLFSENRLWVSAEFRTSSYEDNVKVRYRGNLPSHWNAFQKSYAIEFPKDNLFQGQRRINLIIPSDRRYIDMFITDYRAEKLGLIHPDEKFVRLELNGADKGVLLVFEAWSQAWLEKLPISSLSTIYGVNDDDPDSPQGWHKGLWDSWNMEEPIDFEPLDALVEIIEHAPDDVFKRLIPRLIDIEDWYALETIHILSSGYHGDSGSPFGANNLVLIFDRGEGRFKTVPYNTIIYTPSSRALMGREEEAFDMPPILFRRILSIPEFRARRDEVFNEYVRTEKADDLNYLENWKKTYNREFLLDNAKNDNHFMYLSKINESSQAIIDYFDDPFDMLSIPYDPPVEEKEELKFPDSFKHLAAAGTDPLSASQQHPSLTFKDDRLFIPRGVHTFKKTMIIPADTQLTIAPGTTLRMEEGVSFISYSPVIMEGSSNDPITITGATNDTVWGVFAILNTNTDESSISYVNIDNGSEDTINGAYISGSLALHNANGTITHTTVSSAQGDDGINIKGSYVKMTNNSLIENSSDGVDLDFVDPSSVFANNEFLRNRGDAIDISWSDLTINNNTIMTCADKGISVGESSNPTISENIIIDCVAAMAIKDSSVATATNNTIIGNTVAFALYKKKPYFSGSTLTAQNNILIDNTRTLYTDELSTAMLSDNSTTTEFDINTVPEKLRRDVEEFLTQ